MRCPARPLCILIARDRHETVELGRNIGVQIRKLYELSLYTGGRAVGTRGAHSRNAAASSSGGDTAGWCEGAARHSISSG